MPLLEVEDLYVHYGKALAIEGLSLYADEHEILGVLGPNGAGKSSLLKAIAGAVERKGAIRLAGRRLDDLPAHRIVGCGVCHCPEGRRLFPELTVRQNLDLGAYLRSDKDGIALDRERVCALFPVLAARQRQQANTLSGGEQQMLAIGRALMGRPRVLLLDEPSVGIAHRLKTHIFAAIRTIRDGGVTVILVEQDARSTLAIADRLYVLEHGRIKLEGSAAALGANDYLREAYLGV